MRQKGGLLSDQQYGEREYHFRSERLMKFHGKQSTIDINPEFRKALDIMEKTDSHVFITGKAGTGKSTLLDYFRRTTEKEVAVLAPTGVAALNIDGQTIHSFFNFKP